ncbi:MAG TPA: deoxynucleoside kinase [Bacteroidia bacterium]|nr:deoxynucleoside kinase [Bacteroidia bacterium]
MDYRYIAIEGNIGAGKSTLAKMLAGRLGGTFVPEKFGDNPFLVPFYEDPARHALPAELSFLEDRFRQVRDLEDETGVIVSDYAWEKSIVFARINLKGEELRLFERIYNLLSGQLRPPDILFYLHRPVEKLVRNISSRGRDFEKNIQADYLGKIAAKYRDYLSGEKTIPVIWMSEDLGPEALTADVLKKLGKAWKPGLHLDP